MINLIPELCLRHKTVVLCRRRGGACPPLQRQKTKTLRIVNLVWAVPWFCVAGGEGVAPPLLRHKPTVLCRKQSSGARSNIYCGINPLCWISTPALRQKLRIGQTSTINHIQAFGVGLGSKLGLGTPFSRKSKKYIPRTAKPSGWL